MKNKHNTTKKSLIRIIAAVLIGILLLIAVLCFFVISDRNADIKPGRIGRIGKHIYYPEDTFFSEKRTEEQNEYIKNYLESIDKKLDEGDTIYGTYLLKYDMEDERLYYEFTLNRWSYVNVDAKTGEIIGWNFDNGVVY